MNDLDLDVSDVWIGADAGHTVQLLCFVHQDGTTEYGIFGSQNTENLGRRVGACTVTAAGGGRRST